MIGNLIIRYYYILLAFSRFALPEHWERSGRTKGDASVVSDDNSAVEPPASTGGAGCHETRSS